MKQSNIIALCRDPRYVAASVRHTELQRELSTLDSQLVSAYSGLGSLTAPQDAIRNEASALLEGAAIVPTSDRAAVIRTIDDLTHRIAVLRQAVEMQRSIVERLRCEIGGAIASESLPRHVANVAAVVDAAITLSTALQAERELRDELIENDIPFSATIRAMPLPGFDLRDDQSRLSRYLSESFEHGFVQAAALPDLVRERLSNKPKPQPRSASKTADFDGWAA